MRLLLFFRRYFFPHIFAHCCLCDHFFSDVHKGVLRYFWRVHFIQLLPNIQVIHQELDSMSHSRSLITAHSPSHVPSPIDSGLDVSAGGTPRAWFLSEPEHTRSGKTPAVFNVNIYLSFLHVSGLLCTM